jgi:hypothetical protein
MDDQNDKIAQEKFEAKHNLTGFFRLLLKVAIRENIDIGLYENNGNTNNPNQGE